MDKPRSAAPVDAALAPMRAAARQQAACATAMFRGFEAMRKVQEHAAHAAAQRHAAAGERLKRECAPAQVAAIQSDLLRFDLEASVRYWQQLAAAAMEMQTEMLASLYELVDADTVLETVSALTPKPH